MREEEKSKEQLLSELRDLRRQLGALRARGVAGGPTGGPAHEDGQEGEAACLRTERQQAEEALRQSEERLRSLIEATPDIVCFKDGEGRWLEANQAALELFGLCGVDYRGKKDCELAEAFLACEDSDKSVWEKGAVSHEEEAICRRDGVTRVYDMIKVPTFHDDGKRKGLVVLGRDITERKQIEESLREREAQLKMALDVANMVHWEYDVKTGMFTFDEQFYAFYGTTARDEGGTLMSAEAYVSRFLPPEESHIVAEEITRTLATTDPGFTGQLEHRIFTASGETRHIVVRYAPVRDRTGTIVKIRGANQDITDRKLAEGVVRESMERLSQILDFLPDPTFAIDLEGRVITWNRAYEEMTGIKAEEVLGKGNYEYSLPFYGCRRPVLIDAAMGQDAETLKKYSTVQRYGDILLAETDAPLRGGETRAFSCKARPLYDSTGKIIGALETIRDVTEIKRTQEMLRDSEQRYRSVVENIQDIFYRTDRDGAVTMISPSASQVYGAPLEEILGMHVDNFWLDPGEREKMIQKIRQDGVVRDYEIMLQKKDGSPIFASITSSFLKDKDGNILGVEGIIRDISERKRAEAERTRLAMAVEQAAEGIIIADAHWRIEYANPAFERITGYGGHEIVGRHAWIFNGYKYDRSLERQLSTALLKRQAWSGRLTNQKKDGALYDADVTVSAILDDSGDVSNYVAIHRDISREILLEKELRQAQKMEALGTLAGGIAHDFNNILGAIIGYTELAKLELGEQNPVQRKLGEVLKATIRAKELVQQILVFGRRSEQQKMPLSLGRVIKEAMRILRPSLPSTIEIKSDVTSKHAVMADPTQMHQVLMNLCTNAAHAMQVKGGILEVRLTDITVESEVGAVSESLSPGHYVELRVSDTGHGIESPLMELIFDPFFTTKGPNEGTGLGLSVVHGIVKSHGGAISVESHPGKGTSFTVLLPALEADSAPEKTAIATVLLRGRERILVVDDEPILAEMIQQMLQKLGYEVVSRTNGMEALEAFKRQSAERPFNLVITDMTMPGLTGMELARKLFELEPEISVILMTGFSKNIHGEGAGELGIGELLMKPVTIEKLAQTVRTVLDRKIRSRKQGAGI
ncbi:MAG: PAS domain S-box protein [Syntrophobacteraceae bacterium]|nr:PAS domain S-box protein [Syntrophobacteraceae bacterium]